MHPSTEVNDANHAAAGHVPVLLEKTLALLAPVAGETFVDCTFGRGGHARAIAASLGPGGRIIVVDQDPEAVAAMEDWLANEPPACRVDCIHGNFGELPLLFRKIDVTVVDGLLADLGASSPQFDAAARGFSFRLDGPLDMRMDPTRGETAASIVGRSSERELARMFWEYGEEKNSRRIAAAIGRRRRERPIETTADLADIVRRANPPRGHDRSMQRIDPATRTFQALRIAVNDELGAIERLLDNAPRLLRQGARAGFIAFHSLEDRAVKRAFQRADTWDVLTRKPAMADEVEAAHNPRARSAKLRVARRR